MQSLVEKYRPATLDAFAGMERPRAILSHLAANPYESAWLLAGPSGTGKTSMALALAEQLRGELHHIPSSQCNLETVERITAGCHYAPMFGERWHVVLADECDKMSNAAQVAFLSKLDATAPPPNTIFVFTTNNPAGLETRFLSRCRVVMFDYAGLLDPACRLLAKIWVAEAPGIPAPDFAAIMKAAGYNLRTAIMNLELEMIAPAAAAAAGEPAVLPAAAALPASTHTDPRIPPAGTVIVREFRDRQITVHVLAHGFQFEDREYTSLSAIAREVTQGNRNGFTFFRLGGAAS